MRPDFQRYRTAGAYLILSVVGLISIYHPFQLVNHLNSSRNELDEISLLVSHVDCVRQNLPDRGEIGYFTERDGSAEIYDFPGGKKYFLTQYTLVPLVVKPGLDHIWIVGNLRSELNADQIALSLGIEVVQECPGGTYLFRNP